MQHKGSEIKWRDTYARSLPVPNRTTDSWFFGWFLKSYQNVYGPSPCLSEDDTIGDLKKLIAAQTGTRWEKIVLKKWSVQIIIDYTLARFVRCWLNLGEFCQALSSFSTNWWNNYITNRQFFTSKHFNHMDCCFVFRECSRKGFINIWRGRITHTHSVAQKTRFSK